MSGLVPGAVLCRIVSPNNSDDKDVTTWTLPSFFLGSISPSVGGALGGDLGEPSVWIHPRVAQAMGIDNEVELELLPVAKRFKVPIKLIPADSFLSNADIVVHGAVHKPLAIIKSFSITGTNSIATLHNGKELNVELQALWSGTPMIPNKDRPAVVYVSGSSRNDDNGPSGYGYHITTNLEGDNTNKELVRGYGYYAHGDRVLATFKGLLEAVQWASRLHVTSLVIRSDAGLVVRQCQEQKPVNKASRKPVFEAIMELVKTQFPQDVVQFEHQDNETASVLADIGVDSQTHSTFVHWPNVNQFLSGS